MRTQFALDLTIYFPDEIVYMKDNNRILFRESTLYNEVFKTTASLVINADGIVRKFFATTRGGEIIFDLSYYIQEIGAEAVIDYISFTCDRYPKASTFSDGQSRHHNEGFIPVFAIKHGYTLPNRRHYSERSAYVPPLAVYQATGHEDAEEAAVEFSSQYETRVGGKIYPPYTPFAIDYSDACATETEVEILNQYDEWRQSNSAWSMGITNCIIDRCIPDADFETLLRDWEVLGVDDVVLQEGFPSYYTNDVVLNMILEPVQITGTWRITAINRFGYDAEETIITSRWFTLEEVPIYIHCDKYDDLLDINYLSPKGRWIPSYDVYRDIELTDYIGRITFDIRNHYHAEFGELDLYAIRFYVNCKQIKDFRIDDVKYDYLPSLEVPVYDYDSDNYDYNLTDSMIDRHHNLRYIMYGCHSQHHKYAPYYGQNNYRNWCYYTGSEQDCAVGYGYHMFDSSTDFVYCNQPDQGLENGVPIQALWHFFNNFGQYSTENQRFTFNQGQKRENGLFTTLYIFGGHAVKQADFAISQPEWTKGISFIHIRHSDIFWGNWEQSEVSLYLYPSAVEPNYWKSADIKLIDGNGNYRDLDGNIVAEPVYRSLVIHDEDNVLLNFNNSWAGNQYSFTEVETNQHEKIVQYTMYSSNSRTSPSVRYGFMPFTCNLFTCKKITDTADTAYMPSLIGLYGNEMYFNHYYVSPFNVGRTTRWNNVTYNNIPHPDRFTVRMTVNLPVYSYDLELHTINGTKPTSLNELFNAVEAEGNIFLWTNIMDRITDFLLVINEPCRHIEAAVMDTESGKTSIYQIIAYNQCDAGSHQTLWLHYRNMDGDDRYLPMQSVEYQYKAENTDLPHVLPYTSAISSFPLYSPTQLSEKMKVIITDVPKTLYIEDMLYSDILEIVNEDGSMVFPVSIDKAQINRDFRQEYQDFTITFIKKI